MIIVNNARITTLNGLDGQYPLPDFYWHLGHVIRASFAVWSTAANILRPWTTALKIRPLRKRGIGTSDGRLEHLPIDRNNSAGRCETAHLVLAVIEG